MRYFGVDWLENKLASHCGLSPRQQRYPTRDPIKWMHLHGTTTCLFIFLLQYENHAKSISTANAADIT